jgi:hypothetical protein
VGFLLECKDGWTWKWIQYISRRKERTLCPSELMLLTKFKKTHRWGLAGSYINTIKATCKRPAANITVSGERPEVFSHTPYV